MKGPGSIRGVEVSALMEPVPRLVDTKSERVEPTGKVFPANDTLAPSAI